MAEQRRSLAGHLAESLPEGVTLTYYHLSTPPTPCSPLYSSPSDQRPEKTYCESQSLLVTVNSQTSSAEDLGIAVFAIELQIYTTANLTTIFVSKADSTGYLSILDLPRRNGSVLRTVTSAFVSWMVKQRLRPDRRLVVSLFARSQNQYLFPGSVENGKKHVLDDRALVKWWCKTLDPVLREYNSESTDKAAPAETQADNGSVLSKGYLIVPGHDSYETQSFFPLSFRTDPPNQKRWSQSHPLIQISPHPGAPPRCLVPHFPDDPKARFLNDLDDELADVPQSTKVSSKLDSPSKRGRGQWKSVRTIEQFWELMAFRQECSSGRLVGFIWIVFTPTSVLGNGANGSHTSNLLTMSPSLKRNATELDLSLQSERKRPNITKTSASSTRKTKKNLTGPVIPRRARVKSSSVMHEVPGSLRSTTHHFHWPPESRGTLVLTQKAYDRVHELLLRLDFSNLEVSQASTKRWLSETGIIAGRVLGEGKWGRTVSGTVMIQSDGMRISADDVSKREQGNTVTMLTVKRKKTEGNTHPGDSSAAGSGAEQAFNNLIASDAATSGVSGGSANLLGSGLVRKKAKPTETQSTDRVQTTSPDKAAMENSVNSLGAALVRKKPKS